MEIYLLIDGQQQGPYTADQVKQSLAEGQIPADLPAWHDGLADWVQVEGLLDKSQSSPAVMNESEGEAPQSIESDRTSSQASDLKLDASSDPKWKGRLLGYAGIGVAVLACLIILGFVALKVIRTIPATTGNEASKKTTVSELPNIPTPTSTSAKPSEIPVTERPYVPPADATPSREETQNWLKNEIEAVGGEVTIYYPDSPNEYTLKISYDDVTFDGDIVSWNVNYKYSTGEEFDFRDYINLSASSPDGFSCGETEQTEISNLAKKAKPVTHIGWVWRPGRMADMAYMKGNPPDVHFHDIEVTDQNAAKRIAKALNLLVKLANPEPF